jgi:hypothetical protein
MIYFITAREVGRVKIGYSADPVCRFQKIRCDNAAGVVLERVTDGTTADEAALHTRYAADCVHGEWYRLTDEIEALMGTLEVGPHVRAPGKGSRRKAFAPELRRVPA